MLRAAEFIVELASRGRYHFTTDEAVASLRAHAPAVLAAMRRLKAKGQIADPHRSFHVVVPPEYRRLGCLPAEQFVPQLMEHLGETYYVALLSAGAYGFVMASNYNTRPTAAEILVKGKKAAVVRERQPIEEIWAGEAVAPWLKK